jgi:hypothetical protein
MFNNNYNTRWGDIQIRPGKRGGIEIHAYNHERGRSVHVGTVKGAVYEKGNCAILRKPEPSFCLNRAELQAAREAGAQFVRMIADGKTYSISLTDFERSAEYFNNVFYGLQMRAPLRFFAFSSTTAPRNPITDNPPIETAPSALSAQAGAGRWEQPSLW